MPNFTINHIQLIKFYITLQQHDELVFLKLVGSISNWTISKYSSIE